LTITINFVVVEDILVQLGKSLKLVVLKRLKWYF